MSHDLLGLVYSYLYIGLIVGVGEIASRRGLSRELSRKFIHVMVGLWIFGTLALFDSRYMAVIPPITAAIGNWLIHRFRLLRAVEAEPDDLGTVWFPIAFAILILVAWDLPVAAAGGVMAMTFGDALASLVGRRWGRHGYATPRGGRKSLEGSLVMLASTYGAVLLTLCAMAPLTLVAPTGEVAPFRQAVPFGRGGLPGLAAIAVLTAVTAMCAEALGDRGQDNLWVPLSSGAVIYAGLHLLPTGTTAALAAGALLATVIGILAWRRGSLTTSGALGAILTGTLVFGLGGWSGGLALVGFFLSSSLLSGLFRSRKAGVEKEYAKTGTRDLGQALANGGVAALAALAGAVTHDLRFSGALLGALAAANADTWATELGVLSRSRPRLITTLRHAEPGTSGAISTWGTLAALVGAAFVGLVAAVPAPARLAWVPGVAVAGLAGCLADSLLGATVQAIYRCPACERETERRVHHCGTPTVLSRGLPWLGNDLVNLLATLVGGVIGFLLVH